MNIKGEKISDEDWKKLVDTFAWLIKEHKKQNP